jgi:hypothetical protein
MAAITIRKSKNAPRSLGLLLPKKPAILIMTFTAFKSPVILAGMPVSSHRDVKPQGDGNAKSSTYALSKLPSMALDFGIPAKMTAHIAIMRIAAKKPP